MTEREAFRKPCPDFSAEFLFALPISFAKSRAMPKIVFLKKKLGALGDRFKSPVAFFFAPRPLALSFYPVKRTRVT